MQRFLANVNYFPAGDWLLPLDTVVLGNASDTGNILKTICYGDVDGSYTPPSGKRKLPGIEILSDTVITALRGWSIRVPVMAGTGLDAAAISLVFNNIPASLQLTGIETGLGNLLWSTPADEVRIAWYDVKGKSFVKDEVLFTLIFSCGISGIDEAFHYRFVSGDESVIGDVEANPMEEKSLRIPFIDYTGYNSGEGIASLGQNRPNPFTGLTTIPYYLDCEGKATLEVHNALGERLAVLANAYHTHGWHEAIFDAGRLQPGIYFYTLRLTTANAVYQQTERMVVGY
jgi:hypothetical protein